MAPAPKISKWISFIYSLGAFRTAAITLVPGASVFVRKTLGKTSQCPTALWVSWTQAPLVFQMRCFGDLPSPTYASGAGVLDVGHKPLVPPVEATDWRSFLTVGCCTRSWGFWPDAVSASPTHVSDALWPSDMKELHSEFSGHFQTEVIPYVAVDSACPREEGKFRIFLCCHPGPSL